MAEVNADLEGITLNEGEDEFLQYDQEDVILASSYIHCFVGRFLTSSVINFLSMKSTLANVWRRIMRIRVRLDISLPLKRRKKLMLPNGKPHYVRLDYERKRKSLWPKMPISGHPFVEWWLRRVHGFGMSP
ncbi:hypothetical protein V6N13_113874 [Hibiscus sabdariffa]